MHVGVNALINSFLLNINFSGSLCEKVQGILEKFETPIMGPHGEFVCVRHDPMQKLLLR